MVTNARPPNETILAIAVPLLAAAGLHPPTRPSMDAAAELLTLDRRLPAEAKSVTRRNLTGNKRVAAFHFYCGAGGLWYGTPTTRPCLPLHCICMAAQPGPPIKAKTLVIKAHQGSSSLNQGKNPCNRVSSRLIKASAKKHLPLGIVFTAWRLELGAAPPYPLSAIALKPRHQGSIKPPIKAKTPAIKPHQASSRQS